MDNKKLTDIEKDEIKIKINDLTKSIITEDQKHELIEDNLNLDDDDLDNFIKKLEGKNVKLLEKIKNLKDKLVENAYQRHICNSVGIKFNCIHEELSEPIKIFNSDNQEEVLKFTIETLEEYTIKAYKYTKQYEKMINVSMII